MDNPDKAREDLQEILNQREYQVYYEDNRNFLQIWWDNIKTWFRDLLSEWLSGMEPSNAFADTLLVILIGAVIILTLFVLFIVVRSVSIRRALQEYQQCHSLIWMDWSDESHLHVLEMK